MVQSDKERKAKDKARRQTTDYKAKAKAREQTTEYKAKRKERYSSSENKAKAKARRQTPENKAKEKIRKQTPEYKEKAKARKQTTEYKAWNKKYDARPENREKANTRRQTTEHKVKRKNFAEERRLKILQTYSKRLSNSDIPCCNCCKKNSHVDFLSIDHIEGKKQMELDIKLMELGYSSKLNSGSLRKFLIENDFPVGFQVLCHNCNTSKGLKDNNNQCPHERK